MRILILELKNWKTRERFLDNGFPLSRNPSDLYFFSKYLIFCRELIKDSQRYVPEFLEDIIEKILNAFSL